MSIASSKLETLALELDPAERAALLEKLRTSCNISNEAIYRRESTITHPIDYKAVYKELGFITKLIITIKVFFGKKSQDSFVKEHLLKSIYKSVALNNQGLIDPYRGVLQEQFYRELNSLKTAARYFYDLLDKTLEKNRAAFFAFLASLELEAIHNELYTEVNPNLILERNSLASDSDVRIALYAALDSAVSKIDDESRRIITNDVQNLYVLKKLSSFLFDRFLNSFQNTGTNLKEVSLFVIIDLLDELASTLISFENSLSPKLMGAIIAFSLDDKVDQHDDSVEESIKKEMANSESALAAIRAFNKKIPIEDIVKIAHADPDWQYQQVGGGEDWFTLFKTYWKNKADKLYKEFAAERSIARLSLDIKNLVGTETESSLLYLQNVLDDKVPPVQQTRVLFFLEDFFNQTFIKKINRWLKIILLEGEFYKRDNRLEFTDAYNNILQSGELIINFDRRLAPESDLGLAYVQAKNELSSVQIKKRKMESAIKAANSEAENIITNTSEAIKKMSEILKAIISGEARGKYDSLSNLGQIDGKANKEFQKGLSESAMKLEKAYYLVEELNKLSKMVPS